MLSKNEIVEWLAAYDLQKYPVTVYHELVVEQRPCAGRIETLGAWKTGCLKAGGQGRGYVDQNGTTYSFTARWNPNSPVGYSTWQEISKNENDIKEKIPKNYPQTKPAILAELESRKGFGFIWALFVLHCFFPETYPLFDQHVYRVYRYIVSKGSECPLAPPLDWGMYSGYRDFFLAQVQAAALPYWEVDRALWAYGKHIKQLVKARGRGGQHLGDYASENTVLQLPKTPVQGLQHEWVHSITFGGKAKSFWWKIDNGYNIHITRAFNGANKIVNTKLISPAETERLNNYMAQNGWVPLANNVEKLRSGEEKHGIGRFLYEQLGWSTTDSQLAGHLGVIFSLSGVWEYNGKKKGIEFRQLSKEWRNLVRGYYHRTITADD